VYFEDEAAFLLNVAVRNNIINKIPWIVLLYHVTSHRVP